MLSKKTVMRILLIAILIIPFSNLFSQKVIDTLETEDGTMILYSNRTWTYLEDLDFDGVMNDYLYDQVISDTSLHYTQTWDKDLCYTSELHNDVNQLKDTIWMCVQDSIHDNFVIPVDGVVTSRFGWRRGKNHNGIDLDLVTGDTVRAAWSGKIRYAKYNTGGFGNLVVIRHFNGLETFYAHLSSHLVVPNQIVMAGEPIGLGGNTGHSRGSHLHFEVRFYDMPLNPERIIDFKKNEVLDENLLVHRGMFRSGGGSSTAHSSGSSNGKYYRVRSGDTLGAIARRNRTSVSRLCQLNGIRPTTVLQIGRNIRVR